MGNSYAERVQRDRQRYLDIGLDSGAQIVHDMLCVALRDKQAMGDDVWGKERIVRLLTRLNELKEEFGPGLPAGAGAGLHAGAARRRAAGNFWR